MSAQAGIYGYRVQSAVPLARLRAGDMPRGQITIERTSERLLAEPAEIIQLVEGEDDELVFVIARTADSLLAWCSGTGEYRIRSGSDTIETTPAGTLEDCQDRLLNALIPLLLIERGELVLHGSAVLTEQGAIVACGPSGRGKSTLGSALAARGFPVLAEDAVAISFLDGRPVLWPGPVGIRLDAATSAVLGTWPDAAAPVRGKHLHVPTGSSVSGDPVPLLGIVCLEPREGSELRLRPVHDAEALANVFLNVYRLERERWPNVLRRTAELTRHVACYRARMPDDLGLLRSGCVELVEGVAGRLEPLRAA